MPVTPSHGAVGLRSPSLLDEEWLADRLRSAIERFLRWNDQMAFVAGEDRVDESLHADGVVALSGDCLVAEFKVITLVNRPTEDRVRELMERPRGGMPHWRRCMARRPDYTRGILLFFVKSDSAPEDIPHVEERLTGAAMRPPGPGRRDSDHPSPDIQGVRTNECMEATVRWLQPANVSSWGRMHAVQEYCFDSNDRDPTVVKTKVTKCNPTLRNKGEA